MGSGIAWTWPLPLPPLAGAGSARNSFSSGMGFSFLSPRLCLCRAALEPSGRQPVGARASGGRDERLEGPHAGALASVVGDVKNVVGNERDVRGFALQDLIKLHGDFVLRSEERRVGK